MQESTVITRKEAFLETAASAPPRVRVPVEVSITVTDPFQAYRRAREPGTISFYLETTGGQDGWSYFGRNPVDFVEVHPVSVDTRSQRRPSFEAIDSILEREKLVRGDCDVPYPCGAFGWLSYDIARELERLPSSTIADGLPRLQLGVFDCVAAWRACEKGDTQLHVTACPVIGGAPASVYEIGREKALALAEAALHGSKAVQHVQGAGKQVTFESECGEAAFTDRVQTIKQHVHDGETFQTNISHRLVADAAVHPVETFSAVRRVNPAPYSGLLEFPDIDLISASPELLLDIDGERLSTEPIAGTRPRGDTPYEDNELERELRSDEKERAEHAMLVDLERNDLGKVSTFGSVDVMEYCRVDRYAEVMHLVSRVIGRRRADASIADAVAAVFPGGTITGAPKPRTMELIDEVEATRRGPYTGSIGVFGFDERATLNIVIRTLVHHNSEYRLRVGAGIVHDSTPEEEYQETLDKARALVTAVDEALGVQGSFAVEEGIESMEESE